MAESEQRNGVMLADVLVTGNLCRHAIGILVERLPDCGEDEIEASIKNLEGIEKTGLRRYLDRTDNERNSEEASGDGPMFHSFEPVLGRILDDSLTGLGEQLRYTKNPTFKCTCGVDRVWRALRLLPKDEIREIVDEGEEVSMKCEFCGESYGLSCTEIKTEILDALQ
jgi:redox-regulated HSP33 family molecular chaperone